MQEYSSVNDTRLLIINEISSSLSLPLSLCLSLSLSVSLCLSLSVSLSLSLSLSEIKGYRRRVSAASEYRLTQAALYPNPGPQMTYRFKDI